MAKIKSSTQYNHYKFLKDKMIEIWVHSMRSGRKLDDILAEIKMSVYESPRYVKLTQKNKECISAISSGMLAACYVNIKWLHTYDGNPIEKLDEVLGPDFCQEKLSSGHFWYGNRSKPF